MQSFGSFVRVRAPPTTALLSAAGVFQRPLSSPPRMITLSWGNAACAGGGSVQKWTRQVLRCHVTVRWARPKLFLSLNHACYIRRNIYWVRALNHFNRVAGDDRHLPRSHPRRGWRWGGAWPSATSSTRARCGVSGTCASCAGQLGEQACTTTSHFSSWILKLHATWQEISKDAISIKLTSIKFYLFS